MRCERSRHACWCEGGAAVFAAVLTWLCHGAWFWWRLTTGRIRIDAGEIPALRLYWLCGEAWDGLFVGVLAGVAAYLAFRHWLCPLRLCERTDRGGKP